jgi:hypothetical protein
MKNLGKQFQLRTEMEKKEKQEKQNEYEKKRYLQRRNEAFEILGTRKCIWCNAETNLQLDHIHAHEREIFSNKFHKCSYDRFLREVIKLQVLCCSCHAIKTNAERNHKILEYKFSWELGKKIPKKVIDKLECENEMDLLDSDDEENIFTIDLRTKKYRR